MKQLGNLAIVCAQRPEVLMQLHGGRVTVYVGSGPERVAMHSAWDDDTQIKHAEPDARRHPGGVPGSHYQKEETP